MKILEAKKTKRGYYFEILVNDGAPEEDKQVIKKYRWGLGRILNTNIAIKEKYVKDEQGNVIETNTPEILLAEIKRQLSAEMVPPDSGTDLAEKGQSL